MELKITTQKSRLSEMEGALSLSQENANKVRQKSLQVWLLNTRAKTTEAKLTLQFFAQNFISLK